MKRLNILIVLSIILTLFGCSNKNKEEDVITPGYRTIIVSDFNGEVNVTRSEGDDLNAYEGLSLFDGDNVRVLDLSDLTLTVDSDKYLYAEENTYFSLEATGSEGKTKTRIHLEKGSILCRVEKPLTETEIFEVVTDTSTMSVRGTVFGISIIEAEDGTIFELVNVYDGKVYTNIDTTGANVTIEPGQCALIRDAKEGVYEKDIFVVGEAITNEFFENPTGDIQVVKDDENPIGNINYEQLSSTYIEQLIEMADDGEELSIEKEQLEEVKEIVVEKEEAQKVEEAKQEEVIEEVAPVQETVVPKEEEPVIENKENENPPAPTPPPEQPKEPDIIYHVTDVTLAGNNVVTCSDNYVSITMPFNIELTPEVGDVKKSGTGSITIDMPWDNETFIPHNPIVDPCEFTFDQNEVGAFILAALQDGTKTYQQDAIAEVEKYEYIDVTIVDSIRNGDEWTVNVNIRKGFKDLNDNVYIYSTRPDTHVYIANSEMSIKEYYCEKKPNDTIHEAICAYIYDILHPQPTPQ